MQKLGSAETVGIKSLIQCTGDTANRLAIIKKQIEDLAHRAERPTPKLLAVSKLHPPEAILDAWQAGQRSFGESYVAELVAKAKQLPESLEWHFIGHLQSNKCRQLLGVPNLKRILSVDSTSLAVKLATCCASLNRTIQVLVQVNTTPFEASKTGVEANKALELARFICHDTTCRDRLLFKGFMTIGSPNDATVTAQGFAQLQQLKAQILSITNLSDEEVELSMGMSNDLEVAISHGSTEVRVGSAIFGQRPPKRTQAPSLD